MPMEKFMQLRDYIEAGLGKMKSYESLAIELGIAPSNLSSAKQQKRGLPTDAAIKLAHLLNVNPLEVIAASELATEKKPEKRDFWSRLLADNASGMSYIRHMMN